MAEGEREFLIEAARVKQIRIKNSERYAKRRAADTLAIEAMANAMVEIADGDLDAVRGCYRVQVAAASEQSLKIVDRLWRRRPRPLAFDAFPEIARREPGFEPRELASRRTPARSLSPGERAKTPS